MALYSVLTLGTTIFACRQEDAWTSRRNKTMLQSCIDDWDLSEPENDIISGFWMAGDSLAPPCQSEMDIVLAILEFAGPSKDSVLYDLGCGDGRICILASKLSGCRSVGCEIEEQLIAKFHVNVERTQTQDLVSIVHEDLRRLDLAQATIIVIYLLQESLDEINEMLLAALRRGCVIICNTWGIRGLQPEAVVDCGPYKNCRLLKYSQACLLLEGKGKDDVPVAEAEAVAVAVAVDEPPTTL